MREFQFQTVTSHCSRLSLTTETKEMPRNNTYNIYFFLQIGDVYWERRRKVEERYITGPTAELFFS